MNIVLLFIFLNIPSTFALIATCTLKYFHMQYAMNYEYSILPQSQ